MMWYGKNQSLHSTVIVSFNENTVKAKADFYPNFTTNKLLAESSR